MSGDAVLQAVVAPVWVDEDVGTSVTVLVATNAEIVLAYDPHAAPLVNHRAEVPSVDQGVVQDRGRAAAALEKNAAVLTVVEHVVDDPNGDLAHDAVAISPL